MAEQNDPLAERAARFRQMPPQLVANVRLYETEKGGRQQAALPGWGCPCMTTQQTLLGYDGWPILEEPLCPGDERDGVAFVFLTREGGEVMRHAGHFYLWEGRFIGEATVIE